MHECSAVPWDEIPESAQVAVVWWIRRLAQGDSARITFETEGGGVRGVREEVVVERYEDGSRRVQVATYTPDDLDDVA